ncbi:MAG TPA: hypothetical protein VJ754_03450, partial [Anaerolineae bacterium]|nr:hypothetical protein [Anaerolineae bacterium]
LVMTPILLRPWLGRRGALLTSLLLLISPSILYHARYIRDEAFMLLYSALMLWAVMSYLRDRVRKWLLAIAVITALMYTTMETAFIYIMIFGGFAAVLAVVEVARASGWGRAGVGGALLGLGAALALTAAATLIGARLLEAARPPLPDAGNPLTFVQTLPSLALIALFGVLIGGGVYFVARAILPDSARRSAGLDVAIILGGLSLFMLSAAALLGLNLQFGVESQAVAGVMETVGGSGNTVWGLISGVPGAMYVDADFFMSGSFPTDPANVVYLLRLLFLFTAFAALGVGLGVWWNPRIWLIALGSFGGIAVTLFTTIFTKGVGLGTGFVGSLGYWLAQHKVQRGTQPTGYYFFITPFYEYLPTLLALAALVYFGWRFMSGRSLARRGGESIGGAQLFVPLLMLYVVAAWAIFSFAGEKMPWLMTHLALPMIVLGGRLAGDWLDRIDWRGWWDRQEWLAVFLAPLAVIGVATATGASGDMAAAAQQGAAAPSLDQLNAAGQLLSGGLIGVIALVALFSLVRRGGLRPVLNMAGLAALIALALMTVRTAWQFSFVNYDYPTEFGVYAHGGPGLKIALEQIRQLSERTTGTPDQIELLYDNKATWPWLWYLRDFPNKRYIAGTPSRSDASLPVLILSDVNWPAIDQSVGSNYNWFQFARIWWPMEDYKRIPAVLECPDQVIRRDNSVVHYKAYDENGDGETDLTEQRNGDERCAERARQMNSALWGIFFRRDYSLYGDLTGQKMTLQDWPLHEDFRLYVRKDLAAKVWDQTVGALGPGAAPPPLLSDPYQARWTDATAIKTFGSAGAGDGQMMLPHGMAV